MSGAIEAFKGLFAKHNQRIRDRQFLEAAMGATALLATADGEISFAELMARDYVLDRVRELQVFPPNEAAELFRTYAEAIEDEPEIGKAKVIEAVMKLSGDRELAPLLLRICVAIGKADNDFNQLERKVVTELCEILGLETEEIEH